MINSTQYKIQTFYGTIDYAIFLEGWDFKLKFWQ